MVAEVPLLRFVALLRVGLGQDPTELRRHHCAQGALEIVEREGRRRTMAVQPDGAKARGYQRCQRHPLSMALLASCSDGTCGEESFEGERVKGNLYTRSQLHVVRRLRVHDDERDLATVAMW